MNGCNENAIEFMTNGTKATLTFSQGRYKSVIRKLAEKHPDDCQIVADNEDGSICAHVPVALDPDFSSETVYRGTASADEGKAKPQYI